MYFHGKYVFLNPRIGSLNMDIHDVILQQKVQS